MHDSEHFFAVEGYILDVLVQHALAERESRHAWPFTLFTSVLDGVTRVQVLRVVGVFDEQTSDFRVFHLLAEEIAVGTEGERKHEVVDQ